MPLSKEERIFTVFLQNFNRRYLPTLSEIKVKLEKGETLEQSELLFLEQVFSATQGILPKIIVNPEYRKVFVAATSLFNEITELALKNIDKKASDTSMTNKT